MRSLLVLTFVIYVAVLLAAGFMQIKGGGDMHAFCLGNRKEKGILLGLSAQVSDIGIWLFLGLPGAVYAFGAGKAWIAVGLFIGTVINWQVMPYRLMRYAVKSKNVLTIPEFLSERFKEKKCILKYLSSFLMFLFMLVYVSALLKGIGNIFDTLLGVRSELIIGIILLTAVIYTVISGFKGIVAADFCHGIMILLSITVIPICIAVFMRAGEIVKNIMNSRVPGGASVYLNVLYNNGELIQPVDVISQLSFGIAYMGMPHILTRFMAAPNGREINKGRRTAIIWSLISLVTACVVGALCRAYLYPMILSRGESGYMPVFLETIRKMFMEERSWLLIAGILVCSVFAAVISFVNAQLLTLSSTLYHDVIKGGIFCHFRIRNDIFFCRLTIVFTAVFIYIISVLLSFPPVELTVLAWMMMGCSFGPVILMSLYWKRMNRCGAVTGLLSGAASVIIWNYAELINTGEGYMSLYAYTGLSAILPCFFLSLLFIVLGSLATKDVEEEVKKEFEDVRNRIV